MALSTFQLIAAITLSAQLGTSGLGPFAKSEAASTHGPFAQGDCAACHDRNDPRDPGPASPKDEACVGCHDDFATSARVKTDKGRHPDARGMRCVDCHNPHNARKPKLVR